MESETVWYGRSKDKDSASSIALIDQAVSMPEVHRPGDGTGRSVVDQLTVTNLFPA